VCPPWTDIYPDEPCNLPGNLTCEGSTYLGCYGKIAGNMQCTCSGFSWHCLPIVPIPCDDAGTCPMPSSIQDGVPCTHLGMMCLGSPRPCNGQTEYDVFLCETGGWVDVGHNSCAVDAGAGG
jgi:hypothetical protein